MKPMTAALFASINQRILALPKDFSTSMFRTQVAARTVIDTVNGIAKDLGLPKLAIDEETIRQVRLVSARVSMSDQIKERVKEFEPRIQELLKRKKAWNPEGRKPLPEAKLVLLREEWVELWKLNVSLNSVIPTLGSMTMTLTNNPPLTVKKLTEYLNSLKEICSRPGLNQGTPTTSLVGVRSMEQIVAAMEQLAVEYKRFGVLFAELQTKTVRRMKALKKRIEGSNGGLEVKFKVAPVEYRLSAVNQARTWLSIGEPSPRVPNVKASYLRDKRDVIVEAVEHLYWMEKPVIVEIPSRAPAAKLQGLLLKLIESHKAARKMLDKAEAQALKGLTTKGK